ncbi:TVP38/TMEM64 family protein [bacterium]|nr:TVP38/TMEM64 family protein [bacterium]
MAEKKNSNLVQIGLFILVLIVFGLTAWYFFSMYDRLSVENVRSFIDGFGAWAPVAFILLYTISSPIPLMSTFISAAAGLLFGTFPGTLLAMFSATFSGFIPFFLSRSLGRDWVEKRIKSEQLQKAYAQSEGQGGFLFILLMRLIPILPWEVQNYIAGLTKVKIPAFIFGTLLGIIPGSFSLAFLGSSISDPTSWQFYAAIGANVVAFLIPAGYIFIKNRLNKNKSKAENSDTVDESEAADEMGE